MFAKLRSIFSKKNKQIQNVKRISKTKRILELDEGDSCLILKQDGVSVIIDSGSEQLTKADEIVAMVWCYLANPEFVKILETMFSDIVDEINSDKMRDKMGNNTTIGRSGVYAKESK